MLPFPAHCLGWFCLGYHTSDLLGRDACIADFLLRSGVALPHLCTPAAVRPVLEMLLSSHTNWLTPSPSNVATATFFSNTMPIKQSLATSVQEWMPVATGMCNCGKRLVRWRLLPATFFTLAYGVRSGNIVCLRCLSCKSVYAGCWKWLQVQDDSDFPNGFHAPLLTSTALAGGRWFFATPQVVFECVLLAYFLGFVARGGLSFTAIAVVYEAVWSASLKNTQYRHRTHFLQKLELNVIVFASVQIFWESGIDFSSFVWHLRPHHLGADFSNLLVLVRKAFSLVAGSHSCWLFRTVRLLVLDGKWSMQTRICNARNCNSCCSPDIEVGFFKGCTERPLKGSLCCRDHIRADGQLQQAPGPDAERITEHRKIVRDGGLFLEYRVGGAWVHADVVDVGAIRAYERTLLRKKKSQAEEGSCNKDDWKDIDETVVGHKNAGCLVAVTPCLQIAAITPLWGSESITQLLLFLLALQTLFTDLAYVIYDNACPVARHLRKRLRENPPADPENPAWKWLIALTWVIDRLHFTYHKSCRDINSSWYVAGVDARDYPVLKGVDTEAAEQIFSLANRWQLVTSSSHPVHSELLLLICSRDHNRRHSCGDAAEKYRSAQNFKEPIRGQQIPDSSTVPPPLDALEGGCCEAVQQARQSKKRKLKLIQCACSEASQSSPWQRQRESIGASSSSVTDLVQVHQAVKELPRIAKSNLHSTYIWINSNTNTVHHSVLLRSVTAGCGYFFGQTKKPQRLATTDVDKYFSCGSCYGWSARIYTDDA